MCSDSNPDIVQSIGLVTKARTRRMLGCARLAIKVASSQHSVAALLASCTRNASFITFCQITLLEMCSALIEQGRSYISIWQSLGTGQTKKTHFAGDQGIT